MFSIMGIEVIKRNTEYLESSSSYVIVSNHQSALDVIGKSEIVSSKGCYISAIVSSKGCSISVLYTVELFLQYRLCAV